MVLTAEQVKEKFIKEGRTFSSWAKENGFRPNEVYQVVNGASKAKYGRKHEIAKLLGMK